MPWSDRLGLLFRPGRLKYIKRDIKKDDETCVFCEGLKQGVSESSLLLYEDEHTLVFVNKFPYNNGHILVLPRRHECELLSLNEEEFAALHKQLRHSVSAIKKTFSPHAVNIGMNLGRAAGAGIPQHLHYHIVPRWSGDANFFPIIADSKAIAMTPEQVHQSLLPHYQ